ncbi:MAG TPA: response regulator [Myxococcaceae bacterium]|nr:response regulator [Myxococcaceae bacterium]
MSPEPHARRILLVEDDGAIRAALIEVLADLGYEVVSASDGLKGLGLAAEQPEPCPILLDWRMPVLDGPAFLVRLRELPRGKEFPVILSTADRSATCAGVGDEVAAVLSKPFDLDALFAVLDRVAPREG